MARVAVIGGGYGGVTVAKGLDPIADVVLIEQKDQFVHHAAALRAAVDTVWEHAIFMPYTNLLHRGEVVRGTVSRVDGTTVHVFGHDPIEADYVVFATGSTYPFPAKYSSYRSSVAKARLEQLHENLGRARSVMIVGGGTVGIELTGELANAFPGLDITIVEASDQILGTPGYTDALRNEISEQLSTLGVRVGKLVDERGGLVGALVVRPDEDVMVITESGKLVQVNASDVRPTARNTMGVIFARPDEGDRIIAITRNTDSGDEDETDESENTEAVEGAEGAEVAEATDAPADEASAPAGGDDTADADK